jgi:hypothetical protein
MRQLASCSRFLAFLALLGVGVAGGSFTHADELAPLAVEQPHHADAEARSHGGDACCETETQETIHCGTSFLVPTPKSGLPAAGLSRERASLTTDRYRGIDTALEPPPPRIL